MQYFYRNYLLVVCISLWYCTYLFAQKVSDQSILQLLVNVRSPDNSTSYLALKSLEQYPPSAFDETARNTVDSLIRNFGPYYTDRLKLAGYLQMKSELKRVKSEDPNSIYTDKIQLNKTLNDQYRLALVKSGDQKTLNNMVRNMKKLALNDDYVYSVVPQAVYARQKAVFDLLLQQIMVRIDYCTPADSHIKGQISCAYRIIEEIAPYIDDFPVKSTKTGIDTDNYPKALAEVRAWIRENKNSYTLKKDVY